MPVSCLSAPRWEHSPQDSANTAMRISGSVPSIVLASLSVQTNPCELCFAIPTTRSAGFPAAICFNDASHESAARIQLVTNKRSKLLVEKHSAFIGPGQRENALAGVLNVNDRF